MRSAETLWNRLILCRKYFGCEETGRRFLRKSSGTAGEQLCGIQADGKKNPGHFPGLWLQCFDMRKGTWNHELCSQFGVPERILPSIYNSDEIVGCVTEEAAKLQD